MRLLSNVLAPAFLLVCLVLGGASAAGYLANGLLQIVGILFVVITVLGGGMPALQGPAKLLLALIAATFLLLALELVPLPPEIWSLLPGRALPANGYAMIGVPQPWLPVSLSSDGTLAALAGLIPVATMALLVFAASPHGRLCCVYVLVGVAIASILLGVVQKIQGPNSASYIYETTNRGGVVGLFANRNHLATLLLAAIPFVGALATDPNGQPDDDRMVGRRMIAGFALLLLAAGTVIVMSVAGWMLLAPVVLAAIIICLRDARGVVPSALFLVAALIAVGGIGLAMFAPIHLNDLGDKLSGIDPHMRNMSIRTTAMAAMDYLPFGSGGGSFTLVYPHYEAAESVSPEYLNHAHNDYVEVFLEHGLPGLALVMAGLALWLSRTGPLWRRGGDDGLSRAGFVVIAIIAAHSLVDYPARTAAIGAVLGLAFALVAAPIALRWPAEHSAQPTRQRIAPG